ncbi:MAG: metallophosphoesterase [Promethearchaeota archaeon]
MALIDVIFADIHIGLSDSRWDAVLDTLKKLTTNENTTIGAIIFAGDTVDITRAKPQQVTTDLNKFCKELKKLNLLHRSVFLHGNHDPTINQLLTVPDCILRPTVLLRFPDTNIFIVHGHGIGLEAAISCHGYTSTAFAAAKQRLIRYPPLWLQEPMSQNDWLVACHYALPHIDFENRTAGLSPWTGSLDDNWHGHYLIIRSHPTRPILVLCKRDKPIPA